MGHIVPSFLFWGLWGFGLLPIFDNVHWVPATIAVVFASVITVGMFLCFGFWGTPASGGQSGGEDYESTFTPMTGFGLGWLRWLMQLVMVFLIVVPTLLTVGHVRPWYLTGTDELDALPTRAATIPIPTDWEIQSTKATETGFPEFLDMTPEDGAAPEGYVESRYDVPAGYTFADLKAWMDSTQWDDPARGDAFGAIRRETCDSEGSRCDARLVPAPGEESEYFVTAVLTKPSSARSDAQVRVRLRYQEYAEPDYDVSDETVDRAQTIPTPSDWTRYSVLDSETNNGESFTQFFSVPDTYTQQDLKAWLTSDVWTAPAEGSPFGAIRLTSACRLTGAKETTYLCSAIVTSTEKSPSGEASGPVESLRASLDDDHTVQIGFSRNG